MNLPPPQGDTPLEALPQYDMSKPGGDIAQARYYAGQDFYKMFGRNPTASELSMLAQAYYTGDKNLTNGANGQAAVAQYYQDQLNSPLVQKQITQAKSGQYTGTINDLYNELLKRGATSAEVQHFGGLLASGEVDPYELRSFIQQTPEYQSAQDVAFRSQVGNELANLDTQAFGRQKEDVISRFAGMGRSGSTALDFALTDLMGRIAEKRQGFLANLSAQQYGSNKENARADYGNILGQMQDTTNYGRSLNDQYRQRGWNVADYNRQKEDYFNALEQQKRPWWQYAVPGMTQGLLQAGGQIGAAAIMA